MDAPSVQASSSAPVLMPALVPEAFDYLVPPGTAEGTLVEATLAGRTLVGAVWQAAPAGNSSAASGLRSALRREPLAEGVSEAKGAMPPSGKKFQLKPILRTLDHIPPLPARYRQWLDWVAEFTLAPKGAVLSLCGLAHAAKTPKKALPPQQFTLALPTLTAAQQQVAEALLREVDSRQSSVVSKKEAVIPSSRRGPASTPEQRDPGVAKATRDDNPSLATNDSPLTTPPKPTLLDGVTGSGKTEVYFHAIAAMLQCDIRHESCVASHGEQRAKRSEGVSAAGAKGGGTPPSSNQLLILLPEIALTHQWLARFEKVFGATPVVWHSRMTPVQKARAWQAIARGEAQVVVGARSALFLPFANLSLIVVDEEHDPSYKQEDGVLYHARDMAVARARFEGIPIILASATPSLETMENVREGKYRALTLPERFGEAGLPSVALIDMRNDPPERGDFLSPTAKRAMLDTLARGEQVLFFLNRRGYAPLLLCRHCGHRFQCKDCSAWLSVHGSSSPRRGEVRRGPSCGTASSNNGPTPTLPLWGRELHCHHCNHREPMPKACPACNAEAAMLAPCGPGVERIAEEVRGMFRTPSPLRGEAVREPELAKTLPIQSTLHHAKALRRDMTKAELALWTHLRHNALGIKFRKQHPVGHYIADFACLSPQLIIELDGGQHADDAVVKKDAARTVFLEAQGFTVLRFWNNDVLENMEGVFTKITSTIEALRSLPHRGRAGVGPFHTETSPPDGPHLTSPLRGEEPPRLVVLSSDEAVAAETWEAIEKGEIDILVGTQMVAKGHHFPRLTLVVVVDADVGLSGADLRAGERTYQLLHQLAGRAGRGELPGRVLVQTYEPTHPVMQSLAAHDRARLMALEAKERKAGGWPPFGSLAAILLDGVDETKVRSAGMRLAQSAPVDPRLTILGPAPAALSKLRGQFRYRILVKAKPGIHLQRTLRAWLDGQKFSGVRIKIDVNPYYFM